MTLLFVEDDSMIGESTCVLLKQAGFNVHWAKTGSQALQLFENHDYEFVLLDLGLPSIDGMQVLQRIRKVSDLPVLILTARDHIEDRVSGLEQGADDYLVKPYHIDELLARIRALLRRAKGATQTEYMVGDIKIIPAAHAVYKNEQLIDVSAKEWSIIETLAATPNSIFSREQLEQKISEKQDILQSNTVEVHIHNIRQKLGKNFIKTIRGLGYKIGNLDAPQASE